MHIGVLVLASGLSGSKSAISGGAVRVLHSNADACFC